MHRVAADRALGPQERPSTLVEPFLVAVDQTVFRVQ
jgi:hypothetical protein